MSDSIADYIIGDILESDNIGGRGSLSLIAKTCRFCGQRHLTWTWHNGRWLLGDGTNIHVCPVNPFKEES